MAYRIQYSGSTKYKFPSSKKEAPIILAGIIISLIFLVSIVPEIRTGIRDLILPGDAEVTYGALTAFAEDLKSGESVKEAITAFCQDIIANGEIS